MSSNYFNKMIIKLFKFFRKKTATSCGSCERISEPELHREVHINWGGCYLHMGHDIAQGAQWNPVHRQIIFSEIFTLPSLLFLQYSNLSYHSPDVCSDHPASLILKCWSLVEAAILSWRMIGLRVNNLFGTSHMWYEFAWLSFKVAVSQNKNYKTAFNVLPITTVHLIALLWRMLWKFSR
jgi:hypothetical protein